jgi:hypothetical protein
MTGPGFEPTNLNYSVRALCLPQMVSDPVTDAQVDAAARWGAALIRAGLAEPGARWHGHRCVAWKDCPGERGWRAIPQLQDLTRHYAANGLEDDMPTAEEVARAVWATRIGPEGEDRSARQWLLRGARSAQRAASKDIAAAVARAVEESLPADTSGMTRAQIVSAARKGAERGSEAAVRDVFGALDEEES